MKRLLSTIAICVLSIGLSAPASAGQAVMEREGERVGLECDNSGCYLVRLDVEGTADGRGLPQRIGEGGTKNFRKWGRAMRRDGWIGVDTN